MSECAEHRKTSFRWSLHTVCFGREWCFWNSTVNEERFSSCYVREYAGITPVKWFSSCHVYTLIRKIMCYWRFFFFLTIIRQLISPWFFFSKHHQKNMPELVICSEVYLQLHFFLLYLKPPCLKTNVTVYFFFLNDNNNKHR